jgi:hypothetical protein
MSARDVIAVAPNAIVRNGRAAPNSKQFLEIIKQGTGAVMISAHISESAYALGRA